MDDKLLTGWYSGFSSIFRITGIKYGKRVVFMKNRIKINRFVVLLLVCVFFFQTIGNITVRAYVSTKNDQQTYSIKNISFTYSDYRYPSETLYFNGNDGKSHILVFGGVSSCLNTINAYISISELLEKTDKNVEVNIFDIANNSTTSIVDMLNKYDIPTEMHVSNNNNDLYSIATCAAGVSGSFTMPIICYVDKDGNIQRATVGYQNYTQISAYALKYTTLSTGKQSCINKMQIYHNTYYNYPYELLDLINQERIKNGLQILTMDKSLLDAAEIRALESTVSFCDIRPDGTSFDTVNPKVKEEILVPKFFTPEKLNSALFSSQDEKNVLLNPEYKSIGIALIRTEGRYKGSDYWALCFGTQQSELEECREAKTDIYTDINVDVANYDLKCVYSVYSYTAYNNGETIDFYNQQPLFKPSIEIGDAEVKYEDYYIVSSNPECLLPAENGELYALNNGSADITYTNKHNPKINITIHVNLTYDFGYEDFSQKKVGEKYHYDDVSCEYTSITPDIACIEDGCVVGIKPGIAVIREYHRNTGEVYYEYYKFIEDDSSEQSDVTVSYRTHVQFYGWQDIVTNGTLSGTSGRAKRLEGIEISVNGNDNLGIQYTTHCQSYGWLPWSANGETNGTEGEAKRLEAIKIQLTGADKDKYDVYYRVHAQSYGWLGWAKNGEPAGTAGYAKRLEAIQIVVVKKGESAPGLDYADVKASTSVHNDKAYIAKTGSSPVVGGSTTSATNPSITGTDATNITYRTHVQSYGWQGWKYNGQMSGTSGQAKRLEGINIKLTNKQYSGSIVYTTHVQTYGWQGDINNPSTWKKEGQMAGTSGKAKRLEAICIKLTGEMEKHYDVYYRVHAQSYGWLGWAKNGECAGTAGYAKRLEGIQIVLVPKGGSAPASNYGGVNANRTESYIAK